MPTFYKSNLPLEVSSSPITSGSCGNSASNQLLDTSYTSLKHCIASFGAKNEHLKTKMVKNYEYTSNKWTSIDFHTSVHEGYAMCWLVTLFEPVTNQVAEYDHCQLLLAESTCLSEEIPSMKGYVYNSCLYDLFYFQHNILLFNTVDLNNNWNNPRA